MADIDVESVLSQLTLEEKVSLTAGRDFWHTVPIPRLGVPSIRLSDGPNGVRGTRFFNGTPSACLPCATALGATFDRRLLYSAGRLLGQECKAKGAHVLLGPTINIQRGPLGGRGFESFSEDPYLSGTLAGAYCNGVQEENVISTPKHFVCNDQEHERMAVNSIVTDRALREIYLMPFMLAIRNSRPAAIMTAYNKVNGTHVAESKSIIDILRNEWGWQGLLMSDWFGTYSTSEGINAGQDLEMPGPTRWRGTALEHAVISNKVRPQVLDDRVREVLKAAKEAANSEIPENAKEESLNRPEDREFLRRLASESVVLLKNENSILPFDKRRPVVVIGPNAKTAAYAGGGSSSLPPYYTVTPFEGILSKCDDVRFSQGAYAHKALPLLGDQLRTSDGKPGFEFRAYDKSFGARDRKMLEMLHLTKSEMFLVDYKIPEYTGTALFIDVVGTFVAEEDGSYEFGLIVQGKGQLFINGDMLIDNTHNQKRGTAFFGGGTIEEIGSVDLCQGQSYIVTIRFSNEGTVVNFGTGGLRVGCCKRIDPAKAIEEAAKSASKADQVVLFMGLNGDWESEGFDRPDMDLPEHNDELIERVLNANPNAVVVIQSGTPVTMPWAPQAKTIVQAWYGGNETGNGMADVLFGDVNPSGKLPLSFPHRLSDNPTYLNWGSERGRVIYGEDVYVGYRFYDTVGRPALFPFGHGLSYTTFVISSLEAINMDSSICVKVLVKNTGKQAGAEVVQVYVSQEEPSIKRPAKELQGFRKVFLEPGEIQRVEVNIKKKYAASFWDEEREAWVVEKGKYKILVGNSSRCDFAEAVFEIEQTWWWNGL